MACCQPSVLSGPPNPPKIKTRQPLLQVCSGDTKMPLVHALGPDSWLCGTEAIWEHMEEAHPDAPDLGR